MGTSQNVGKGPYKLTRYKVWEEPPKLIVIMPSEEEGTSSSAQDEKSKHGINDSKLMNI